jgi:alkylated DNA nucleotide flippase Atl1
MVAKLAGKPRAWRVVGNILNKSKGVPCHRVIRSDGKIGGYKYGIKKKIAQAQVGAAAKARSVGQAATDVKNKAVSNYTYEFELNLSFHISL